jgi:hypothetical protein
MLALLHLGDKLVDALKVVGHPSRRPRSVVQLQHLTAAATVTHLESPLQVVTKVVFAHVLHDQLVVVDAAHQVGPVLVALLLHAPVFSPIKPLGKFPIFHSPCPRPVSSASQWSTRFPASPYAKSRRTWFWSGPGLLCTPCHHFRSATNFSLR